MLRQLSAALLLGACRVTDASPPPPSVSVGEPVVPEPATSATTAEPSTVPDGVVTGTMAPPLSLHPVGGGAAWTLASDPARAHLVAFVASWCGICTSSLPTVRALGEANPDLSIVFVTVDTTAQAQAHEAKLIREAGLNVPVLVADAATRQTWIGRGSVPRYVFVGASGKIIAQDRGFGDKVRGMMPRQAERTLAAAP